MKAMYRSTIVLLMVAMILTGCAPGSTEDGAINEVEEVFIPVRVESVTQATLFETILTLGEIEASAVHKVLSGRGTVEDIFVSPGDTVEENQVLFTLDKDSLQKSFNATESQLRTIRDNLKIQRDDQLTTLEKQKQLFEAGAISQADLDRVQISYNQINKQYRDSAVSYSNQIGNLRDGLEDREIKSPISGKVASLSIIENQTVADIMAVEVIDDSSMIVNTNVTADQINNMLIGDRAVVYPDGDRRKEIKGTVTILNEVPNSSTGLYNVELQLDQTEILLRTGEFAEIETMIDERVAKVIPKKAVRKIGEKDFVFVAKDDIAVQREVITGTIQGEWIEVVSGLSNGESVVVRGQSYLKDQSKIEIVND